MSIFANYIKNNPTDSSVVFIVSQANAMKQCRAKISEIKKEITVILRYRCVLASFMREMELTLADRSIASEFTYEPFKKTEFKLAELQDSLNSAKRAYRKAMQSHNAEACRLKARILAGEAKKNDVTNVDVIQHGKFRIDYESAKELFVKLHKALPVLEKDPKLRAVVEFESK